MKTFISISYHGETCGVDANKEIELPFAPTPQIGIMVAGGLSLSGDGERMTVYWDVEDQRFVVYWRPDPRCRPCEEKVAHQIKAFEADGWDIGTWGNVPAIEEEANG